MVYVSPNKVFVLSSDQKSQHLLHLGLTPPYFPEKVTKNQFIFFPILDPFLSTLGKKYFFPLKLPQKYEKSAKK